MTYTETAVTLAQLERSGAVGMPLLYATHQEVTLERREHI